MSTLLLFKCCKRRNLEMYYLDTQRTVTRRESSLISSYRKYDDNKFEDSLPSTARVDIDASASSGFRPKGAIRKELVSWMFNSMLHNIVNSWQVLKAPKVEPPPTNTEIYAKSPSELTVNSRRRKSTVRTTRAKKSKSNIGIVFDPPSAIIHEQDPLLRCWFSAPSERAVIQFKNGNVYEGDILMKCMDGVGRFQWADGTVYMGEFKENEIKGNGRITWKDDTWYEGTFAGNVRHGHGLYVDSRKQRSYSGGWDRGTKHGEGTIYYSSFTNSYDGEWINNVRHGFGVREYCANSGYKGEWDLYIREGKGLMIWPNHDLYRGEWENGVMSGYGIYIWGVHYNNSMSLEAIAAYRGHWKRGKRDGFGLLELGMELGAYYKGEFKKNKKNGMGKLVTNSGLILQSKNLFTDDNLPPLESDDKNVQLQKKVALQPEISSTFNMCDISEGLLYHVEQAFANIDKEDEIRKKMVKEFLDRNKYYMADCKLVEKGTLICTNNDSLIDFNDLIIFEEVSLKKSIQCYEKDLNSIYRQYSTICNTEDVQFPVIMTRLYLWQFYYDCNIIEKGLSLVDIDLMLQENPKWLVRKIHNPFEKILFWQFLHSLICVARKLYAKRELPGPKPDTILAGAFRKFMDIDVLPGVGRRKGHLVNDIGLFVPLHATYDLYCKLGEPHTVRTFLRAVRYPSHAVDLQEPLLIETPDEDLCFGQNCVVYGHQFPYITEKLLLGKSSDESTERNEKYRNDKLKLFNFSNISTKGIIEIFAQIFPNVMVNGKVINLDIEMTFYEFFEAFISCAKESVRLKDEENEYKAQILYENNTSALPPTPVSQLRKLRILP